MSGESAAPRSRWRRWGRRALALLGALAALALCLRVYVGSPAFRRGVTQRVEAILEERTGEQVQLGDLSLRFWPPRVDLSGLVIRSRVSGEVTAVLDHATVTVRRRGWRPRIGVIILDKPVLRLSLVDGALQEFPGLQGGGGQPLEELPFDELHIRSGSFHLAGPDDLRVRLDGVDLRPGRTPDTITLTLAEIGLRVRGVEQEASAVVLDGIYATPQRVIAPEFALDFPLVSIRGGADVTFGGPVSGALELAVDGVELNRYMPDGVIHLGRWWADVELLGTTEEPRASLALSGKPVFLDVRKLSAPKRYVFGEVTALSELSREGAAVEQLALDWAEGRVEAEGRVDWKGRLSEGVIRADELGFSSVMKLVGQARGPWVDFEGDLEIGVAGTLSPLALDGPFDLVIRDFLVDSGEVGAPGSARMLDIPSGAARGQLSMDARGIRIQTDRLRMGRSVGALDATIGFTPYGPLDLELDLTGADLADFAPLADMELAGRGRLSGRVAGPFKDLVIEGAGSFEDFRALDIPWADRLETGIRSRIAAKTLDFVDFQARRGETDYAGDLGIVFSDEILLDLEVGVDGGRLSDLSGMFLEIPGLEAAVSGGLSLEGPYDRLDGHARFELAGIDLFGEAFRRGRAVAWMDRGRFTLEELVASRRGGEETVRMRGSVGPGWAVNAELIADHIRLETMDVLAEYSQPVRGELALDARIGGTLFSPEPHGRLAARELLISGEPAGGGDLYFDTADEVLSFEGTLLDGALTQWGRLELFGDQGYEVNTLMDRVPAHLFYPVAADGRPVTAVASGEARVSGAFGDTPTPVAIEAAMDEVELAWGGHTIRNAEPWRYEQRGRSLLLSPLHLVGDETDLTIQGRAGQGRIDFTAGGTVDLDLVRAVVEGIERSEGVAQVDFRLVGPTGAADARLTASTDGAVFRTEWFPHALEELSLQVVATPELIRVTHLQGLLGGGDARGSGTIHASDWIPTRYQLSASVSDARVQYLDYLPPIYGDATLRLEGPADALLLSGEVGIQEMIFTDRIDWEADVLDFREELLVDLEEPAEGDPLFSFDIRIRGDGTVTLDNNVARGTADADLHVIGDTNRPGMVGDARMHPGGVVFLQEREFEVARAELRYVDPWSYDPQLDFLLVTEVESQATEYEIRYRISGPFSDWTTTPSSSPALAQADINALLLFGVTQDQLAAQGAAGSLLLQEGADLFLAGLGLESAPLDLIGLDQIRPDRIDLVSGVSERGPVVNSEWRLVIEKDLPEPWDLMVLGELLLDNQVDQYWAVEKNLSRNLYTTAYWSSQQRERYLDIGGAYGLDLKVRWEID